MSGISRIGGSVSSIVGAREETSKGEAREAKGSMTPSNASNESYQRITSPHAQIFASAYWGACQKRKSKVEKEEDFSSDLEEYLETCLDDSCQSLRDSGFSARYVIKMRNAIKAVISDMIYHGIKIA